MKLPWVNNNFITKELYTPFVIEKDSDYLSVLEEKYDITLNQAQEAGADEESLKIIKKYKEQILESICSFCRADIVRSNEIIKNLIAEIGNDPFAVAPLNESYAFPGSKNQEIQFFRCRAGDPSCSYKAKEMLHLPESQRSKAGNYRFSIPGNPCLYLANSSYGCWIETGFLPENDFNVSPVVLDGTQKIFNLAVSIRDFSCLNDLEAGRVHCWLKLIMLMLATSFRVNETERAFKSEYIVSQTTMLACKQLGYDGVAYYSKRVSDDVFAKCAINLALFVDYEGEYSSLIEHIKVDDSMNYAFYRQLSDSAKYKSYSLRSVKHPYITNCGDYARQYSYQETEFFEFDKFLFLSWKNNPNGKGKDEIPWGVAVD